MTLPCSFVCCTP